MTSFVLAAAISLAMAAGAQGATVPSGWTAEGNVGTGLPNGDMTAPPAQGPGYYYVSTSGGLSGVGSLAGVGGAGWPANGSVVSTQSFTAAAGEVLEFFFNYVTSDAEGSMDYGWARLITEVGDQAALLFTARATPSGSSVPGFAMPNPEATLDPADVDITPGATVWDVLGGSSGGCYSTGCGSTGWVKSSYTIVQDGTYKLQFGVTNWYDVLYDSGLAFAGARIGDIDITPTPSPVPLPASGLLLLAGAGAIGVMRRRKSA